MHPAAAILLAVLSALSLIGLLGAALIFCAYHEDKRLSGPSQTEKRRERGTKLFAALLFVALPCLGSEARRSFDQQSSWREQKENHDQSKIQSDLHHSARGIQRSENGNPQRQAESSHGRQRREQGVLGGEPERPNRNWLRESGSGQQVRTGRGILRGLHASDRAVASELTIFGGSGGASNRCDRVSGYANAPTEPTRIGSREKAANSESANFDQRNASNQRGDNASIANASAHTRNEALTGNLTRTYSRAGHLPLVDRIQPLEESTGDSEAIGDKGKARGAWQMTEVAWCEVSAVLAKQNLPTWDWETGAHIPEVARDYAMTYLAILRTDLRRAMKREPSEKELWAAWNMGVDAFRRCGFKLKNCPPSTRRKAERL